MRAPLPLVTIVTPSLNQGRFIRDTIESVLSQSYPSIEYSVMDGGSTDETRSILAEYAGRLKWISEPDRGQANAINKGWHQAHGTILAYLNSDDTYLPHAVERAVASLLEHPEAAGVYGEGNHTDEAGRVLERYPTEPFSLERLAQTCFICQPTVFLRRETVERVGYLDESLRYSMDYDLWIRIARVAPLLYVPEHWATTRLHADTKTLGQRVAAHAEILKTVYRHFGQVPPSWVYAYAHAVLGPRSRVKAWDDIRFVLGLIRISFVTFLRYNWRVPPSEWRRWASWFRNGLHRLQEGRR